MRLAADMLAQQATAGVSRRRVPSGTACASGAFTTWRTSGLYGFTTKPSAPMVMTAVNPLHAGDITTRRPSEASP